jgi:hypothetical protein
MAVLTDEDGLDSSSDDGRSASDEQEESSWEAGHLVKSGLSLSLSRSSLKSPGFWTTSENQEGGLAYSALVRCVNQANSDPPPSGELMVRIIFLKR